MMKSAGGRKSGGSDAQAAKRAKKSADSLVSLGVAIQTKLDEAENISLTDRIAGLNEAISFYERALGMYDQHLDSLYNMAVAIVEKTECGCYPEDKLEKLHSCLAMLERVIALDTSQRAETSGLAHRAVSNAIKDNFNEILEIKRTSQDDLIHLGRLHFREALRILYISPDLDHYYLDNLQYLNFCLDRVLHSEATYSEGDRLFKGKDLAGEVVSIASRCLQSRSHSGIDLDLLLEAADAVNIFIQHALSRFPAVNLDIPELGMSGFVSCLMEYEAAILAISLGDQDARSFVKEICETIAKYFAVTNDVKYFLKYCQKVIAVSESIGPDDATQRSGELGDCLFFIGMTLKRSPLVASAISSRAHASSIGAAVDDGTGAPHSSAVGALDEETMNLANQFSDYCQAMSKFSSSGVRTELKCNISEGVVTGVLSLAALQYECCVLMSRAHPPGGGFKPTDILAFIYNLACIGWTMGDEEYAIRMMVSYIDQLRTESPSPEELHKALISLIEDMKHDDDLLGFTEHGWFMGLQQQVSGSCKLMY